MRIKILFHIDTLSGGGAEKVLCDLVNNMDPAEFDITVQTLFPEDFEFHLKSHVKYKHLYSRYNKLNNLLYRIEAALGLVYPLRMKDNYDIEVAYLECGPTKVIASSTNKKAKKVAWVHCDLKVAFGKPFVQKTKRYYKKYDYIACVSEQCEKSFKQLFGNDFNTRVIHNVIDSHAIQSQSLELLPEELMKTKITLCTLGRFSPQKNYKRLLNTVSRLKNEGFDFDLWVLGDGEQREMIEQMIIDNHLENDVTLLGFQSNPYPFLKESDLLVCSSNYEGFSTFITEGLILGKPIITTNCSGMQELLGDSEYGIVTENNDDAFYQGLKSVLGSHNIRDLLNEMSIKAILQGRYYSIDTLVNDNVCFFKEMISEE